jgi:threonylcarbamoyladenosine tRNA methylthiotransferase MtaB
MPEQVPVHIARERNRVLRELAAHKKREFMQSFIGRELEAITLTHYDGEYTEALTDNYLRLLLSGRHERNQRFRALVVNATPDSLVTERRLSPPF